MMKFGLFFGARKTVSLVDLETGEILTHTANYDEVQRWLQNYDGNYTLTLLNSCNGKIGVDKFQPLWYNKYIK